MLSQDTHPASPVEQNSITIHVSRARLPGPWVIWVIHLMQIQEAMSMLSQDLNVPGLGKAHVADVQSIATCFVEPLHTVWTLQPIFCWWISKFLSTVQTQPWLSMLSSSLNHSSTSYPGPPSAPDCFWSHTSISSPTPHPGPPMPLEMLHFTSLSADSVLQYSCRPVARFSQPSISPTGTVPSIAKLLKHQWQMSLKLK